MLGVNQLDFINYANALKGNYRKGVHKMEAIMASPTHAKEFASNLGGVSVVLSVPIGKEDRNSAQLLDLLLNSDVADDAVYTWLGQFYEFSSWDDLLGDESRCNEIMNDPLKSRAVSGSGVAVGKMVATIAGLSCSAYDDMSAVAASSTARTAIAASSVAMSAIASSSMATAKFAVGAAGLDPTAYADMAAVASSSTAMAAVASSQTAMTAVINNSTALNAVVSSSTAMAAVIANSTALNAVVSSSAAMSAVAASQTAMAAVINSEAARTALVSSSVARKALKASSLAVEMSLVSSDGQYWNSIGTKTMRGLILYTKAGNTDNAFTITMVDSTTLTSNNNARNAATSGSTGYKDWLEAFPNSSWVLSSITFYAYYRTTKIKYIPC